jgi:hypothetical protein
LLVVTTDTHVANSNRLGRTGRRHTDPWLRRSRRGRIAVGPRRLLAMGAGISLLVVAIGSGAEAEIGHHVSGGSPALLHQRTGLVASLRAFQATQFRSSAASPEFSGHHHHHHGGTGGGVPTTTSLPPVTTTTDPPVTTTTTATTTPPPAATYPVGVADATEPSGMSPPTADALPGYTQSYVSDFSGATLPSGWDVFTGNPGGDAGAQWGAAHVTVDNGLLSLNTWKDPAYNNEWVTGGLCQCGVSRTYGAYFVRSRVTGPGPTQVELLWPASNHWPPEIDFNESGGKTDGTSATLHFSSSNDQDQRVVSADLTQWHTWGVIWTPTSVTYTVDGKEWGSVHVASEISDVPMTLDLTQQTWCSSSFACPSAPQSMEIDWVAEYIA